MGEQSDERRNEGVISSEVEARQYSRRRLLQALSVAPQALAGLFVLPLEWHRPILDSMVLGYRNSICSTQPGRSSSTCELRAAQIAMTPNSANTVFTARFGIAWWGLLVNDSDISVTYDKVGGIVTLSSDVAICTIKGTSPQVTAASDGTWPLSIASLADKSVIVSVTSGSDSRRWRKATDESMSVDLKINKSTSNSPMLVLSNHKSGQCS